MELKQELTLDQKIDLLLEISAKQCLEIDWVLRSLRLVLRGQQWTKDLEEEVEHIGASIDALLEKRDRDRAERIALISERPTPIPPKPSGGVA